LAKDYGNWGRKTRVSESRVSIFSNQVLREPHLEPAIGHWSKRKIRSYTVLMDNTHHKEFEAIAGGTCDGVQASLSFARLCPQNAVRKPLGLAEASQQNKTKWRNLWTAVGALIRGLFMAPSNQDLELTSPVSVILTPVGLLVYHWQIDYSSARHC
jgi:hypothetical protein